MPPVLDGPIRKPRRKPRKPTAAELRLAKARTARTVREERTQPKPKRGYTPARPERSYAGPSRWEVDRYKEGVEYRKSLAAAQLSRQIGESKRQIERQPLPGSKLFGIPTSGAHKPKFPRAAVINPQKPKGKTRQALERSLFGPFAAKEKTPPKHSPVSTLYTTKGKSLGQLAMIADRLKQMEKASPKKRKAMLQQDYMDVQEQQAASVSPTALKVLHVLSTPIHAQAGATSALTRKKGDKNIWHGVKEGVKKKKLYGDVLAEHGRTGVGYRLLGDVADIGLDPTTYLLGGRTSAARSAARTAARSAAKTAAKAEAARVAESRLEAGFSKRVASRAGKRAGRRTKAKTREDVYNRTYAQASDKAKAQRGFEISFAGKRIGGRHQVRLTGAVEQKIRGGARKATDTKAGRVLRIDPARRMSARAMAAEIHPSVTPVGMTREQHTRGRQIKREQRAETAAGARRARQRGSSIRALTRTGEHRAFGEAIEADDLTRLANAAGIKLPRRAAWRNRKQIKTELANNPERLQKLATHYRNDIDAMHAALKEAGVPIGTIGGRSPKPVPAVTADVKGARSRLGKTRRQQARAEREGLEQIKPGMTPGPLTKAQKTRARRELDRAKTAKRGHEEEIVRLERQASKASPGVKRKLEARARLVRTRARNADDQIQHWDAVLKRREVPTRRVLEEAEESAPLKVVSRPAPKRGTIKAAKKQVKQAKKDLKSEQVKARGEKREVRAVEAYNKLIEGEAKGYDPRVLKSRVEARGPITIEDIVAPQAPQRGGGRMKPKPPQAHTRRQLKPLEVLREGSEADKRYAEQFTEDPALKYEAYITGGSRSLAQARANAALVAEGRPVMPGQKVVVNEGERVYHRDGANLRRLDPHKDADEVAAVEAGRGRPDEYVVLPEALAEYVLADDTIKMGRAGAAWSDFWNRWKAIAIATPSFLYRNLVGDIYNGLGAQNPARLAQNYFRGQRALNARARADRGYKWFQNEMSREKGSPTTVINGHEVRYDVLASLAEATGAIEVGRLADVADQAAHKEKLKTRSTTGWRQLRERVENSARMGTFIGGLERGLSPEKAADLVRDIHFDYGELTKIEKQLRNRAMPFYTFSARNVPRQIKLLAGRPGVPLAVEKTRMEGARAAGLDEDYLEGLDPYEAKQLGVPIKWNGQTYTVSAGLPITDMSTLIPENPADPLSWGKQLVMGPGIKGLELLGPSKIVLELITNQSLFYREPIKPDPRSGVANLAPVHPIVATMAENFGPKFQKKFGLEKIKDNRTGEDVWAWGREKEAALAAALPGPFGQAYRTTMDKTNRRGFGPTQEALGVLGVRAKPYDAEQAEVNKLTKELETKILPKLNILHKQWKNKLITPTDPDLVKLTRRQSEIEKRLDDINTGRLKFYKGRPTRRSGGGGGLRSGGGGLQSSGGGLRSGSAGLKSR